MSIETSYGPQAFLAVVGRLGGPYLLSGLGNPAEITAVAADADLYRDLFDEGICPTTLGLHVWEGWYRVEAHGRPDSPEGPAEVSGVEESWDGVWRPASLADLARFGFPEAAGGGKA